MPTGAGGPLALQCESRSSLFRAELEIRLEALGYAVDHEAEHPRRLMFHKMAFEPLAAGALQISRPRRRIFISRSRSSC